MFYDAKFGRKKIKEPEKGEITERQVSNGSSTNSNGHVQNTSDLAVYEQYRTQVLHLLHCFGHYGVFVELRADFCFLLFQGSGSMHSNGVLANGINEGP